MSGPEILREWWVQVKMSGRRWTALGWELRKERLEWGRETAAADVSLAQSLRPLSFDRHRHSVIQSISACY